MSSSFSSSTPGKPWQPPAPEDLAPELPQYEILGLLGRGGMGAVYHARQKSLKREVAIKLLPPSIEDADMSYGERFKAEAQVMARLNHPGIIAVYDAGETPGGLLYFVMEYVQGTDVHQMIASSGKLPPQHAHAITAHVCDALAYAHANGLIHRDIKPANIMVDTQGRVKVADFGLAKMANDDHGFTKSNMAVGTPDFVAPEALITGMPVDGRADLYAVGVMLYQMLTGQIPRGAWHPVSVVVPGTDRRFDDIIVKAMQYDREARHSSASELRQHLDTLLMPAVPAPDLQHYSSAGMAKSSPVAAQQEPPQHRAPAQPAKKPLPVESGAKKSKTGLWIGLGAAAALGIGAFVMFSGDGRRVRQNAESAPAITPKPQTLASSATPPSPAPTKPALPPKPEPKPVTTSVAAPKAEPPKPSEAKAAMPTTVATTSPASSVSPTLSSTVAKSPSIPVSESSEKFPPGQWVKVFTKFEDLPDDLRKPESGVKFEDGWIDQSKRSNNQMFAIAKVAFRNVGLRAVIDYKDRAEGILEVRGGGGGDLPGKTGIQFSAKSGECIIRTIDRDKASTGWYGVLRSSVKLPPNHQVTVEIGAVNDHIVARFNNQLLPMGRLSVVVDGLVSYYGYSPIRDIEVINLGGIPEAEALRIIGVDEKGNDTRAAALAAEKQAMEQKQVAQAAASIPELATLDEQFKKLSAERVTAPFDADVAKLNTGYLGGIDRKIAEEKQKGHLDGVLVLETEKKIIQGMGLTKSQPTPQDLASPAPCPIPAEDDATTPANLKALRQIYRDAWAKLESTRAANLKTLTDPLTIRLKQLESTLTQANRIDHAKTVREYRERLSDASIASSTPAGALNSTAAAKSDGAPSRYTQREVAEWALSIGAIIEIKEGAGVLRVNPGDKLPSGKIVIDSILPTDAEATWPITDDDFAKFRGLSDLRRLQFAKCEGVKGTSLEQLQRLTALTELKMQFLNFEGHNLAQLPDLPSLVSLNLALTPFAPADFRNLPPLKKLTNLTPGNLNVSVEHMAAYAKRTNLVSLIVDNTPLMTDDSLSELRGLKNLESLSFGNTNMTGAGLKYLTAMPKLKHVALGAGKFEAKNLTLLTQLKHISSILIRGGGFKKEPDEWIRQLTSIKGQLEWVTINEASGIPDETITALKAALPKVTVTIRK